MVNDNLIHFALDSDPEVKGILHSPGNYSVSYDPCRMKQVYLSRSREARDGMIYMYVAFNDAAGSTEVEMLKRQRAGDNGPVIDLSPIIYTGNIPSDVQEIQIWFRGTTARGGTNWDSKYGNNYRFKVAK